MTSRKPSSNRKKRRDRIQGAKPESGFHGALLPQTTSRIRVTLDQLLPYENNPRTSRNPKFEEILLSIENAGLNHPPNISRRHPDDSHFIIIDGGNTRLEVLQRLYDKYSHLAHTASNEEERQAFLAKAESFFVIECLYKPWTSESKALTGHMSENENRGGMLFIEKALAVQKLRQLYSAEDREKCEQEGRGFINPPLSTRQLAERITADGWNISASHITRYDYAVNTLLGGISEAFWYGAGHPLVRTLRKYDKAYTRFWLESAPGKASPSQIDTHFIEALRENDGEIFDFKGFLKSLNGRLSRILELDTTTIAVEVDAIIRGVIDLTTAEQQPDDTKKGHAMDRLRPNNNSSSLDNGLNPEPDVPASAIDARSHNRQSAPVRPGYHLEIDSGQNYPVCGCEENDNAHSPNRQSASSNPGIEPDVPEPKLKHLLDMILTRVNRLADHYRFTVVELEPVQEADDFMLPYFIHPIDRAFIPGDEDEAACVWWALAKYSGSPHVDTAERYRAFERILQRQYRLYMQQDERGVIGTLQHIEDCIQGKLPNPSVCDQLFEIQDLYRRCIRQIRE